MSNGIDPNLFQVVCIDLQRMLGQDRPDVRDGRINDVRW